LLKADALWCENKLCSDSNPWRMEPKASVLPTTPGIQGSLHIKVLQGSLMTLRWSPHIKVHASGLLTSRGTLHTTVRQGGILTLRWSPHIKVYRDGLLTSRWSLHTKVHQGSLLTLRWSPHQGASRWSLHTTVLSYHQDIQDIQRYSTQLLLKSSWLSNTKTNKHWLPVIKLSYDDEITFIKSPYY